MSDGPWAVVLAGGVGSRFWPLSTPSRPKQLLALVDDSPMLVGTLARLAPLAPMERTLVLTNASLVEPIAAALPDLPRANIVAEPHPAGTAAALAYAAALIEMRAGADAVMICVHADWSIANVPIFRETLSKAAEVATATHGLVTVGIVPTRPDSGFGYIEPDADAHGAARRVARFVEKPSRERAVEMVASGYLWNSGIFVWRVGDFLDEIRKHTPEVAPALAAGVDDSDDARNRFFGAVKSISVDVGVLERSDRVFVMPGDFGWDDVGTWAALHRVAAADERGNVVKGVTYVSDASNNVVHAEGNTVVLFGVEDLVVITRDGLTVVTTRDRSSDLKKLVESLPAELQELA